MDKPVLDDPKELEGRLRSAIDRAKRPDSRVQIGEMGTRYQVSLTVILPTVERHEPRGGLDLWRLLNDLERLTAERFRVDVIAFPGMEVEITGWVKAKPDEAGADQIGYLISIQQED